MLVKCLFDDTIIIKDFYKTYRNSFYWMLAPVYLKAFKHMIRAFKHDSLSI